MRLKKILELDAVSVETVAGGRSCGEQASETV
jgi:hypothetical protein